MGRARLVRRSAAARNHEHVPAGFIRAGLQRELDAASTAERGASYSPVHPRRDSRHRESQSAQRVASERSLLQVPTIQLQQMLSHRHRTPSSGMLSNYDARQISSQLRRMRLHHSKYPAGVEFFTVSQTEYAGIYGTLGIELAPRASMTNTPHLPRTCKFRCRRCFRCGRCGSTPGVKHDESNALG